MSKIYKRNEIGPAAAAGGTPGPAGPANVLTVGTVETLEPGADATVEITGESPAQVISFGIPQGEKGDPGDGSGTTDIIVPALDAPGALGQFFIITSASSVLPGESVSASRLHYSGVNDKGNLVQAGGDPAGGTWEVRGYVQPTPSGQVTSHTCVICIRVDGTSLMPASRMTRAAQDNTFIRNCQYSETGTAVNCEILAGEKWFPFTASPDDVTTWGPAIYASAVAGTYGKMITPKNTRTKK